MKVRIIGVSCDQSADATIAHVNRHGWTSLEHYQLTQECREKIQKQYGFSKIPHVMLVNTEGRIVFKNSPAALGE